MGDTWEIRSNFTMQEPEKVRMSLTTTAQLSDWMLLLDQLDQIERRCTLAYEFRRQIAEMVTQARRTFVPKST